MNGRQLCRSVNQDESIGYGASIQASIRNENESDVIKNVHLLDCHSISLGVETKDEKKDSNSFSKHCSTI